uniref:Uncharacterized protein n=1 Tax=Romanomermis culicivorax TaxID=13658 RepID=A0A915L8H7_ROMCU
MDAFSWKYIALIQECFDTLETKTCIKFRPLRAMTQLEEAYNKPLRIYSILERQCVTTIGYNPYGENRSR